MDYDKLIDDLRVACAGNQYNIMGVAATALSTLQAENAQLRADLEYEREHADAYHEECGQWEAENENLLSDLRRLQTERDTLWAANQHLLAERDADREEADYEVN